MRVSIELSEQNATTFQAQAKEAGKSLADYLANELGHKARQARGVTDCESALRTCSACGKLNMPGVSDSEHINSGYVAPTKCIKCGHRLTRTRDRFRSPAMRGMRRLSTAE